MNGSAYDMALRLLSMREHSGREIRRKLSEKGFPDEEIDDAVSRLEEEGSLSERRYAEAFIRSRLRKSPEGRTLLYMRLKEKGTPPEIAESALSEAWEREDYLAPLSMYYSQLCRRKGEEGARAVLLRKGFRGSEIRAAASLLDGDIGEGE